MSKVITLEILKVALEILMENAYGSVVYQVLRTANT